ncbi:hypothetical protein [Flavobacterium sp. N2038]|uniref:hypothetical protein n=1 Tax=Flavobacterium sp. N2038 TaxID=2986829 RepID=UPI002223F572|nr:hypothetical protein [Flavobacterium sp. N2038]
MKLFILSCFVFFQSLFLSAQSHNNYNVFTNRIASFSKPATILYKNVDAKGNGFIEFTNSKKQVLRFRLFNHNVKPGLCSIAFELYYYEKNDLKRIESLDINGNLIGCNIKLNGEAATEYVIEKPDLYLKKKKLIDAAEGNIDMKDDSNEKIIRVKLFDQNNILIKEKKATYISSKTYWDYTIRMSWP